MMQQQFNILILELQALLVFAPRSSLLQQAQAAVQSEQRQAAHIKKAKLANNYFTCLYSAGKGSVGWTQSTLDDTITLKL